MTAIHIDDDDRIDEIACEWVVRAGEPDFTVREQEELDAWRAADPRHEAAWNSASDIWGELPDRTHLAALAPLHANDEDPGDAHAIPERRRRWFAYAAAAAVLLALLAIPYMLRPGPQQFATDLAQTRKVTLADGSIVTLGPRSSLTLVAFDDSQRRVRLTGGEAFFEVTRHPDRPFLVEAGDSTVRVLGTKFNVNRGDGTVRVAVLEGLVEVRDTSARATSPMVKMLKAGQRLEINAASPLPVTSPVTTLPTQAPGAWRQGRLVYDDVRLADVVADMNRYYAPGITLAEPRLGELRVTAAFKVNEIPAFTGSLDSAVPARATERPDQSFRIEPTR